ncbi:30S ribosomal protein S27 [candidate division MSBL1 archaeon SCGC-AAA261F19]|uniref:Small ribosomal subunit protein eS31 n=2 Tax=candidate division MSBL1 TaxID=215777 RepID=A0A133V947_9EURY|nr:30S ribosomal protein S27 [candidate division MSBL1 archaeon SCGC-AAA261D19]KXB02990.1 30S ribosomal protein S27 [candidate division MSBL1 archaeon SCGC-AAA261F19]
MEEEKPPKEKKPKPRKKRDKGKRYKLYEVAEEKINRLRSSCPRCGPGIFMADHGDRFACGKCGYTEFKE